MASDNYIYKAMKTKKKIRPKTKRRRNILKKRLKKNVKKISKRCNGKQSNTYITTSTNIKRKILSKKPFPEDGKFHDCLGYLYKYNWVGFLTIKFYHKDYSSSDIADESSNRRFEFANKLIENLCNRHFGVKKSQLIWVIAEEYGKSQLAHLHIAFSFDKLGENALGRVSQIGFSSYFGDFYQRASESCDFLRCLLNEGRDDKLRNNQIDLDWRPKFDDKGLCRYIAKLEWGRSYKRIEAHNVYPKESKLLVTK